MQDAPFRGIFLLVTFRNQPENGGGIQNTTDNLIKNKFALTKYKQDSRVKVTVFGILL